MNNLYEYKGGSEIDASVDGYSLDTNGSIFLNISHNLNVYLGHERLGRVEG